MIIEFDKYQGAGNDFVIIDNRSGLLNEANFGREVIERFCDRRFGIGADGLALLQTHPSSDFEMLFYNSDGRPTTMCGNGGRCIVAFAHRHGIVQGSYTRFVAVDGLHEAHVENSPNLYIRLKMIDVPRIEQGEGYYYLNTGSPHYVCYVSDIDSLDVFIEGRRVRYGDRFRAEGTNVNFVQQLPDRLRVATYERGVEAETLACGTGVTAAAISTWLKVGGTPAYDIQTKGGALRVCFEPDGAGGVKNVWLEGPATFVFQGTIEV